MVKILRITETDEIRKLLTRGLQSGHLSILLGSGASWPAIPVAGTIEKELNELLTAGKQQDYDEKVTDFLSSVQSATNALIDDPSNAPHSEILESYRRFLQLVSEFLEARRTKLLTKQATIFTTNYDLFLERAAEDLPMLRLNDGFQRTPSTNGLFQYRPETFLEVTHSTGNLFNYEFAIPTINLVKLHGSLTWLGQGTVVTNRLPKLGVPDKKSDKYAEEVAAFRDKFFLVVPTSAKFERTLMERVYYDLLRLFANRLDLENSLLLAFGFSFEDQHVLDITTRALKNPTLLLVVFAHDAASSASYEAKFGAFNNVVIISPADGEKIDFKVLNSLLSSVKPKHSHESQ